MENLWLNETIAWSAEALLSNNYVKNEADWNEFKNAVEDFVHYFLDEVNDE